MKQCVWAGVLLLAVTGEAVADCPPPQPSLLFASCAGTTHAELVVLGAGEGVSAPSDTGRELVVTGTYTSGEKHEPEGFVLDRGEAFDPYIQGWDGLLLLSEQGLLALAHVERALLDDKTYNMRDRDERRAFVEEATKQKYSAIQSHLLIVDGAVDVREQPDAPRFRRRVLFSYSNGNYGLYDSSPRALSLFEAAQEVAKLFGPEMALNLDMGSYDYCSQSVDGLEIPCGSLDRSQTGKLSNVLIFHQEVH